MTARSSFVEGFLSGLRRARLSTPAKAAALIAGGIVALRVLLK